MAREFRRTDRLAERIQRELAELLLKGINDPRLDGVMVSDVEVSRDLAHARVFLTLPGGEGGQAQGPVLKALERAAGFFRRRLATSLTIRAVPALRCEIDRTLDEAQRIERLLADARQRR